MREPTRIYKCWACGVALNHLDVDNQINGVLLIIDDVIDQFVNTFDEEQSLLLLKCMALPEHGGFGYKIVFFNPSIDIDGYEVDHKLKTIYLDTAGI